MHYRSFPEGDYVLVVSNSAGETVTVTIHKTACCNPCDPSTLFHRLRLTQDTMRQLIPRPESDKVKWTGCWPAHLQVKGFLFRWLHLLSLMDTMENQLLLIHNGFLLLFPHLLSGIMQQDRRSHLNICSVFVRMIQYILTSVQVSMIRFWSTLIIMQSSFHRDRIMGMAGLDYHQAYFLTSGVHHLRVDLRNLGGRWWDSIFQEPFRKSFTETWHL